MTPGGCKVIAHSEDLLKLLHKLCENEKIKMTGVLNGGLAVCAKTPDKPKNSFMKMPIKRRPGAWKAGSSKKRLSLACQKYGADSEGADLEKAASDDDELSGHELLGKDEDPSDVELDKEDEIGSALGRNAVQPRCDSRREIARYSVSKTESRITSQDPKKLALYRQLVKGAPGNVKNPGEAAAAVFLQCQKLEIVNAHGLIHDLLQHSRKLDKRSGADIAKTLLGPRTLTSIIGALGGLKSLREENYIQTAFAQIQLANLANGTVSGAITDARGQTLTCQTGGSGIVQAFVPTMPITKRQQQVMEKDLNKDLALGE